MKEQTIEDIPVQRYHGPKKPNMPSSEVNRSVLPLKVLTHQSVVALERARHLDAEFFKCVATSTNPVEFGGFNTMLCREQGQSVKPATKAVQCFGGVAHMLSGKKFPQNFRALRIVTEELLRPHLEGCESHYEMLGALESISSRSITTRLWVQNLIKPVFIMVVFVRAEREADWPLHLWARGDPREDQPPAEAGPGTEQEEASAQGPSTAGTATGPRKPSQPKTRRDYSIAKLAVAIEDYNRQELIQDLHTFFRRLRLREFFADHKRTELTRFKEKSTWNPPTDRDPALETFIMAVEKDILDYQKTTPEPLKKNISELEWKALAELTKMTNIIIKPTDKGVRDPYTWRVRACTRPGYEPLRCPGHVQACTLYFGRSFSSAETTVRLVLLCLALTQLVTGADISLVWAPVVRSRPKLFIPRCATSLAEAVTHGPNILCHSTALSRDTAYSREGCTSVLWSGLILSCTRTITRLCPQPGSQDPGYRLSKERGIL
ncbi:hypothetical protein Bbelb_071260 [Branchiostoma belcheri]|nr:hypothetical protein Bbelb_071260 [Branchiostoma belcheri]